MNELTALSPLDGRYHKDVALLEAYFSEAALYRYRVRVEIEYLIFLSRTRSIGFVPTFEAHQQAGIARSTTT